MDRDDIPGDDLQIDRRRTIPGGALTERFVTSGGPGGQNVNKVATKVELRLDLSRSGFSADDLARLQERLATRITVSGELVIQASEERSRERNRELARERLRALIKAALARPRPRRASRPTRGSVERRLAGKRQRSAAKSRRKEEPDA